MHSLDEILAMIDGGDIRLDQRVNFLQSRFNKLIAKEQDRVTSCHLVQHKALLLTGRKNNGWVAAEGVVS